MGITVEDGTGIADANAYCDEDFLDTYTDDRAITLADGDAEAAIIRASAAIDAIYRGRFPGYRTHGRRQGMEWPRVAVYDAEWLPIANNEIPIEIKNAVCEFAIRELIEAGSSMPDLDPTLRSVQAGSVRLEYAANANPQTIFQLVDGILARLLGPTPSPFVGYATRG